MLPEGFSEESASLNVSKFPKIPKFLKPPNIITRVMMLPEGVVARRFRLSQVHVSRLIEHYEFLEEMKGKLSPDIIPMGIMLPERLIREVRRAAYKTLRVRRKQKAKAAAPHHHTCDKLPAREGWLKT